MKSYPLPLFAILCFALLACDREAGGTERQARLAMAERYENLLLERQADAVRSVGRGMITLLFLEAERGRTKAERTSLALKLDDRLSLSGDGIKAIALALKYKNEANFVPFVAVYIDRHKKQYRVTGDAVVPPAARSELLSESVETLFTDGGEDERAVRTTIYYSVAGLRERMKSLRREAGIPAD